VLIQPVNGRLHRIAIFYSEKGHALKLNFNRVQNKWHK